MISAFLISIGTIFLIFFLKIITLEEKALFKLLLVALFLHFFLIFFIQADINRYSSPDVHLSKFFNDGEAYSSNALIIANTLKGTITDKSMFRKMRGVEFVSDEVFESAKILKVPDINVYEVGFITYLYAIIYAAYGFAPAFINFLNICIHLFGASLIFMIGKYNFNRITAYIASTLFLFWPTIFFYSSSKLKDPLYIFLIYLFLISWMNFRKMHVTVPVTILILLMVEALRIHHAEILGVFILIYLYTVFLIKYKKYILLNISIIGILMFIFKNKVRSLFINFITYGAVKQISYFTTGGTVYSLVGEKDDYVNYTFLKWLDYFLQGWYHLFFEPTFSSLNSKGMLLYLPFKIMLIVLFILAIIGLSYSLKWRVENNKNILLMLFFVVYGTLLAISSGNVGTMIRHRDTIIPIIFIYSAYFISLILTRKLNRDGVVNK